MDYGTLPIETVECRNSQQSYPPKSAFLRVIIIGAALLAAVATLCLHVDSDDSHSELIAQVTDVPGLGSFSSLHTLHLSGTRNGRCTDIKDTDIDTFEVTQSNDHLLIYYTDICFRSGKVNKDWKVIVEWKPSDSRLPWVQSAPSNLSYVGSGSDRRLCSTAKMHRLRGNSGYTLKVLLESSDSVCKVKETTLQTTSSGFSRFDEKFAVLNGSSFPSWQLVTTSGSYQSISSDDSFKGIYTLDAEGWVVWYYNSNAYTYVWDWLENGNLVVLHAHDSDYLFAGEILEVTLEGDIVTSYTREICDSIPSFGLLDHEIRVHNFSDGYLGEGELVLSTLRTARNFSRSSEFEDDDTYKSYNTTLFGGDKVVVWNPKTNEVRLVYDISEFITPYRDISDGTLVHFDAYCDDNLEGKVIDYTHMNSVSISEYDKNVIVSLYAISTVLSLRSDGGGLHWALSSEIAHLSTFKVHGAALFKGQHDVKQLSNGHLLMMDNDHFDPDCGKCSRSIELRLDFDKRVAQLVWQHKIDRSSLIGSSVTVQKGAGKDDSNIIGPYVIAYCKLNEANHNDDSSNDDSSRYPSRVYEIYPDGTATSMMEIPAPDSSDWEAGNYRAIPQKTIGGEYVNNNDEDDDKAAYDDDDDASSKKSKTSSTTSISALTIVGIVLGVIAATVIASFFGAYTTWYIRTDALNRYKAIDSGDQDT